MSSSRTKPLSYLWVLGLTTFLFTFLLLMSLYIGSNEVYAKPDFGSECANCHNGTKAPKLSGGEEQPAKDTSTEQATSPKNTSAPVKSNLSETNQVNPDKSGDVKSNSKETSGLKAGNPSSNSTENQLVQSIQAKPMDNETCLSCHANKELSTEIDGKKLNLFVDKDQFNNSIHGKLSCTSCHRNFGQVPHPKFSTITEFKLDTIKNCQTCHTKQSKEYSNSIHSKTVSSGGPTCSNCHGDIHRITKPKLSENLLESKNQLIKKSVEQCTSCHTGTVKESYEESFHGKAVALGSTKAPSCVSCHGSHEVLASPKAIGQNCASCHGGSAAKLASSGPEHFVLEPEGEARPMYFTFKAFTWLTIITITLLIIHIELELFRRLKNAK